MAELALAPDPTDTAAAAADADVHLRVVDILRDLTSRSEQGILVAGQSLSAVVGIGREVAEASVQAVDALRVRQESDVPARLDSIDHALHDYIRAVTTSLDEEARVLAAMRAELDRIEQAAAALEGIAGSSRMLAVCAEIETAQLSDRSARGRFDSTVSEMRKLSVLVEELRQSLAARSADLRAEVRDLEAGSAALKAELEDVVQAVTAQIERIDGAGHTLLQRLADLDEQARATTDALVSASMDGLTALQFQDPMIQELQRLDALVGSLTDPEAASDDEVPLSYSVNLGDRADLSLVEDDDDEDTALDAGDLLLF